jgi:hypothetical protein
VTLWTQDKREVLRWYRAYKSKQRCAGCGVRDAPLQFHHMDPTEKRWNISNMVVRGLSVARIKEEMRKCELLCEKCHKREHGEDK